MQRKKRCYIGSILLLFLCILTGCTLGSGKQKENKKADYYIGVVKQNSPYYYEDKDGVSKGYYADILSALSKKYSFSYMFVPVSMSSYEQCLLEESIDGFIGNTVGEMGKEKDFYESESFFSSNLCILVPENSEIANLKQMKNQVVVTESGSEEEVFAKYISNKYKAQAVTFSSMDQAVSDIKNGYSQAIVVDEEYYKSNEDMFKNWTLLKKTKNFQNTHTLVARKNGKLQDIFSKGLTELRKSGELETILIQK